MQSPASEREPNPAAASGAKLPLSCFIITKNEADRIARTIGAVVDWVDEVVVIDSGSTDATCEIAEGLGARVIFNAWPGFGQQKRFGERQCRNDWLLNIDADEVVTGDLAHEIRTQFAHGEPKFRAFAINIQDVYPGDAAPRLWADDYRQPRLYDRRVVRFRDSTLHDSLDLNGHRLGRLSAPIHHYSARTMEDHIAKTIERARYNASNAKPKSPALLRVRVVTEFPLAFARYFIWRRHFMGGLKGFQISLSAAFGRFVRVALMLENAEKAQKAKKDEDEKTRRSS